MTAIEADNSRTTLNGTERLLRTVWDTTLTRAEDNGRVQFVLETRHNKDRRVIVTSIHTRVATPDGFLRREFVLYGPASAMAGVNIASLPVARWSMSKGQAEHLAALAVLEPTLAGLATKNEAGVELAAAWEARV